MTPLLTLIPNAYVPKLQEALTQRGDEELISLVEARRRAMVIMQNSLRYLLQDVDTNTFKSTREQYSDITGE